MVTSRDILIERIKDLPERQRLALHLRYVEGCTTVQVAALLDVSELEATCLEAMGWCAVREALGRAVA